MWWARTTSPRAAKWSLGGVHDGLREIISGVSGTERHVIVDGIQRVRPGAKVSPKTVEMPGAALS